MNLPCLDIIIPHYSEKPQVVRHLLDSIEMQVGLNLSKAIRVTIVNDKNDAACVELSAFIKLYSCIREDEWNITVILLFFKSNDIGDAHGNQFLQTYFGVVLHVALCYAPPYPCAYARRSFLRYLAGEGSVVQIGGQ